MYTTLLQQLEPEDVIIAVNNRLAIHLLEMVGQERPVFPTPHIYSFKQYIEHLWQHNANAILLNDIQIHHLWRTILEQDDNLLINGVHACIKLCEDAFDICQMWNINSDQHDYFMTHEAKCFQRWQKQFLLYGEENNCCTHSQALKHLIECIEKNQLPPKITWVGFDALTPRQMQWHVALNQHTNSCIFQPEHMPPTCYQYCADDEKDEIQTMVQWATKQCQRHQHIACIIPDLNEKREAIIDAFKPYQANLEIPLYNITAPRAIITNPMIEVALHLITCSQQDIYVTEQLSPLLNGSFLSQHEQDQAWSSQLYEACYQDGFSQISRARLLQLIEKIPCNEQQQEGKSRWLNYFTKKKENGKKSPRQWSIYFASQLANMGWPSKQKLDSLHYQTLNAFLALLENLGTLIQVSEAMNFHQATYYLKYLCESTPFQAEGHHAAIQVLGALEAAVIPFDVAWVSGFSSQEWPMIKSPNPFISIDLQRELNTPHASLQREIFFSDKLFNSLRHVAPNVYFSYAKQINQSPSSPAHCIKDFPPISLSFKKSVFVSNKNKIEYYTDSQAPPYHRQSLHGGTQVLQAQINCPFQAFARLRLQVQSPIILSHGLNPAIRGLLLHRVLELFWKKTKSHQVLIAISDAQIKKQIGQLIDQVIKQNYPGHLYPHLSIFLNIEKKRMILLILTWLNYEKKRPNFNVVACERKEKIRINNLLITVKIDRIDQQSNGRQLIIDYKTGNTNPSQWFKKPLQSPQLPLYCAFSNGTPQGIVFAEIRAQSIRFKGICDNSAIVHEDIKSINAYKQNSWVDLNKQWKNELDDIIYQFKIGSAHVSPADPNKHCAHCQLFYLCRYNQC